MGVRFSPAVVPSWRDMVSGGEFQKTILSKPLRGYVDHLLLYGTHSSISYVLPDENDGTVSVASQLAPAARADAVKVPVSTQTTWASSLCLRWCAPRRRSSPASSASESGLPGKTSACCSSSWQADPRDLLV